MDPTLAEMGSHLSDAMKILESGQIETAEDSGRRKLSWRDIPGPLQGDGQNVVTILQLVQNLMHDDEDKQAHRMQYVGEQGHMALLGHSLAAYISVLDKDRLRKLTTRILSDTTLWLCRLFRYENGSAYYHEDDREGLVKVCRLVINAHYEDYTTEGFTVLSAKQPVIYQSAACRPGLGQHLCSQLGLPLSSLCTVPCNTMFGSQHQMDIALLDKLIRDDMETGKLPLLLIANAGTPGAGHTDKLSRLKELCVQYNVWLHVEGVNLATLVLGHISSTVTAATKCDSMTLTPGPWLGLPAVPAVTLYRHEDPALSLAAGLTSSQPVEKLRALPLWLSLQYLGHDGIVERIRHASHLSQRLLEQLKSLTSIKTSVEDELCSPVVVFRFSQDTSSASSGGSVEGYFSGDREVQDALNRWLGEQLAVLVPASGVDVVELEDEGVCVRFNPLMTAAALGTQESDVALLVEKLAEMVPVLSCTLRFRLDFREEVLQHASLSYIEELSWPGLGAVRYEARRTDLEEGKRQQELEKINTELLKKLRELDTDLEFSTGPDFSEERSCIFVGMAAEDLDVAALVDTIASVGREIEESGKLLENMTEVVRKGILEAELQLQKANEDKLIEEGVLRQIPLVSSVMNWFSPVQSSVKGRTFNLAAGSLDTTEPIYSLKAQSNNEGSPETPTATAKRLPGQKLFRRSGAGFDSFSETSSVCHLEESFREPPPAETSEHVEAEVEVPHTPPFHSEETSTLDQRVPDGQGAEPDSIR
ncbi:pyridoxal-dependent decarboxylase domain-containing protein 1 isoform X2 [Salminus brasiliensis]|uniref:pyridoxal-dependent decarboxylase domain-containing protein 1 isoform X2 n=1 Tax=Salminus brasiliensis TaxID=930266 RepID=UPI003B834D5E